ncbi:MAG TPA: hypothetical protein VJ576_04875 [Rhodocyclaceae bacterium]|nr:hypothetical protein [Rhodocyclaceae bacterium]
MLQLELNDQEHETLVEVLRMFLSELRAEVTHTDKPSFRDGLKEQERVLKEILGKLGSR